MENISNRYEFEGFVYFKKTFNNEEKVLVHVRHKISKKVFHYGFLQ